MLIRKYDKVVDEINLMKMIEDEEGWDYADEVMSGKYKKALESSVTWVAYQDEVLCGYSRSLDDCGFYIYVCDLLVKPGFRGRDIGRKLIECLCLDYPTQVVYVMSDVDGYYEKAGFKRVGSIYEVPRKG